MADDDYADIPPKVRREPECLEVKTCYLYTGVLDMLAIAAAQGAPVGEFFPLSSTPPLSPRYHPPQSCTLKMETPYAEMLILSLHGNMLDHIGVLGAGGFTEIRPCTNLLQVAFYKKKRKVFLSLWSVYLCNGHNVGPQH